MIATRLINSEMPCSDSSAKPTGRSSLAGQRIKPPGLPENSPELNDLRKKMWPNTSIQLRVRLLSEAARMSMRTAAVAFAWRDRYRRDVLIDLVCYRRNGHNELDEPRFTQPAMWRAIDARPSLATALSGRLAGMDEAAGARVDAARAGFRDRLAQGFEAMKTIRPNQSNRFQQGWDAHCGPADLLAPVGTGVAVERLREIGRRAAAIPAGITPHPKVRQFYDARAESLETGEGLNFATAEALAFATLLDEGRNIRISGQDTVRGTFTQRHLRVHDLETAASAVSLATVAQDGARLEAINSPLSEYGALSFEYGHSLDDPRTLTLWEAQFGDFLNGAQIAVDQFIVSAEATWQLLSGLVLLLPHGLEGQGPDHSSARIERILQLCANGNIVVANPSTPASYFHLLRRQQLAAWRKPLFAITPKALLRARASVSSLADLGAGTHFRPVIADATADPARARGVILCSGKIYYDLVQAREAAGLGADIAIHRVEQLYPLDTAAIAAETARFANATSLVWCQEEPQNQGAWAFVRDTLATRDPVLAGRLQFAGRMALPVAAGGSIERHTAEQEAIVARALELAGGS